VIGLPLLSLGLFGAYRSGPWFLVALCLAATAALARASYCCRLTVPTTEGWKRRNEIEGLKFFLGVAEADRLRVLNPPDFTPALYERLLPYAVAPRRRDAMEPALRRGVGRFTDPLPAELVRREPSLEPVRHRRFQLGSGRRPRDGDCRRLDADCRRLNGAELERRLVRRRRRRKR